MKEDTKKFISAMTVGFVILLGPALVAATILFYNLWASPEGLVVNPFPFFIIFAGALIVYIASITNWIISRRIISKLKDKQ